MATMATIIRKHELVLDHLIKLRKQNPSLLFVPRKSNRLNRLNKGYWFIGSPEYLQVSFWEGDDNLEKVHNIGFGLDKKGRSYIELSSTDSPKKGQFLTKVAKLVGGFQKARNRNKWFKYYDSSDMIANLDDFLQNLKPKIDNLISKENPQGIYLLNDSHKGPIDKVLEIRKKQIEYGRKNKVARICWNTNGWKYPSGVVDRSNNKSYQEQFGYGHEEWNFDFSMMIDGCQYGFLEQLRVKTDKHVGNRYSISLFTINQEGKKYYVGDFKQVECISKKESERIYGIFEEKGWIEKMKKDVVEAGGLMN